MTNQFIRATAKALITRIKSKDVRSVRYFIGLTNDSMSPYEREQMWRIVDNLVKPLEIDALKPVDHGAM